MERLRLDFNLRKIDFAVLPAGFLNNIKYFTCHMVMAQTRGMERPYIYFDEINIEGFLFRGFFFLHRCIILSLVGNAASHL